MENRKMEKISANTFGKFEANALSSITAASVKGRGYTSTALCYTHEGFLDFDGQSSQENSTDPRCAVIETPH